MILYPALDLKVLSFKTRLFETKVEKYDASRHSQPIAPRGLRRITLGLPESMVSACDVNNLFAQGSPSEIPYCGCLSRNTLPRK